jgi:putative membrane protein
LFKAALLDAARRGGKSGGLESEENPMTKFILRWVINAIALYLAVLVLPGIDLRSGLVSIIWLALIFGLINALFRPLLQFLTCPLIILTLGLFTLVINTFLFWLTSVIGQSFGLALIIQDPVWWNAFLGGLIVTLVSVAMTMVLKDELKGRR